MVSAWVKPFAEWSAAALEIFGVAIIVAVAMLATISAIISAVHRESWSAVFQEYRLKLSRGILLGLEFLVGADIIHTVAVDLTWTSIGVLTVVVLVRTFLSFTLEVEITGRWPWQHAEKKS